MKNHIIFWNRGKAITLALLAPLALASLTRAADNDPVKDFFEDHASFGSEENSTAHYITITSPGKITDNQTEPDNYHFIWYETNSSEDAERVVQTGSNDEREVDIVYKSEKKQNQGGAINNSNSGTITKVSGLYYNNKANQGGSIHNSNANIGNINASFVKNKASGNEQPDSSGGAIYNGQSGQIDQIRGLFLNNTAVHPGGAIENTGDGSKIKIISDAYFIANIANEGTYASRGGAISNSNGAVIKSIRNSAFVSNYASRGGGAIYNESSTIGSIKADFISNSFQNHTETAGGGAILNVKGKIGFIDGNFMSNGNSGTNANTKGSAILNLSANIGKISGSFTENLGSYAIYNTTTTKVNRDEYKDGSSSSIGTISAIFSKNEFGDIYNENSTINKITGSTFTGRAGMSTKETTTAITNNNSTIDVIQASFSNYAGGAISNNKESTIESITASFTSNYITGTETKGGAIYNEGNINAIAGKFDSNGLNQNQEVQLYRGGAIYNKGALGTISAQFTNNQTTDHGGAIYNVSNSTISSINGQEEVDNSGVFENNQSGQKGGAICNEGNIGSRKEEADGSVTITGGIVNATFKNNAGLAGAGAIFNGSQSISQIVNTTFEKNHSLGKKDSEGKVDGGGSGGAIYNNNGTIGDISAIFDQNAAESHGGAIYNKGTIGDLSFADNDTETKGFTSNSANKRGGAIYNDDGKIGNISISFTGNKSGTEGGAIFNHITINNDTKAVTGEGTIGGIGSEPGNGDGSATMMESKVSFTENRSLGAGGAIYNAGKIDWINGAKFNNNDSQWSTFTVVITYKDNTEKSETITHTDGETFNKKTIVPEGDVSTTKTTANGGNGAAIYNSGTIGLVTTKEDKTTEVVGGITNAEFSGNITSQNGGAIYNSGTIGVITNTTFSKNSSQGRGIYIESSVWLDGNETKVEKPLDKDGGTGGAIMNSGTINKITGGIFESNIAGTGGGAICNGNGNQGEGKQGYIGEINVDTFKNNWADYASRGGGAILNRGFSTIGSITIQKLTGNVVGQDDDRTTSGGGGIANYGIIGDINIKEASGNRAWRNNGGVILNWTREANNEEADIGIISGERFHDNFAFGSGGAIHNEGRGATIAAIEVEHFENNISMSSGGAVRNYKGAEIVDDKLNSDFTGNYATNRGGALFFEGQLDKGIFNATYQENASGNDGGAIVLSESVFIDGTNQDKSTSWIETIDRTTFEKNRAGVSRIKPDKDWETLKEWKEDPTSSPATANGGAILNGFRYVDVNIDNKTGDQLALQEWLEREADGVHTAGDGEEYYVLKSHGSTIGTISNSTFKGNTAGYTLNDVPAPAEGVASGGAIANGFIDHYQSPEGITPPYDFWLVARGNIGTITETEFKENKALYRGGAIYNARGDIDSITHSTFTQNQAHRTGEPGHGGAIFNNQSATIGEITCTVFEKNMASGHGGAIFNEVKANPDSVFHVELGDSADIGYIGGGTFKDNTAGRNGGGIYNLGTIGQIAVTFDKLTSKYVGGFDGNTAGGAGGGVYNGESGTIEGFWYTDFTGNSASSLGTAFTNIGWTGKIEKQETKPREYDNIVEAGLTNVSFTGNRSNAPDAPYGNRIAALYTETNLAIIAENKHTVLFDENVVGKFADDVPKEADIYVGAKNGETPDIYMIAEQGSMIHTRGEIDGDDGYVLRLRGSLTRGEDIFKTRGGGNNTGGTVHFDGLVKKADVIMDDVTLIIGHDATDHRAIDTTKKYVAVYDDSLKHNDHGDILYPEDVNFKGDGGEVGSYTDNKERLYSDVLRNSRLEARSGRVMTADYEIINYNIGAIASNGRMSYDYGQGYYSTGNYAGLENPNLYATWSIDINLDTLKADTFTTWYKEGTDTMAQSKGYMTLSGCEIIAKETPKNKTEDWVTWRKTSSDGKPWTPNWETEAGLEDFEHHDHSQDKWVQAGDKFFEADEYPTDPKIEQYYDVNIQVINLIKQDAEGNDITPEAWKKAGSTTESAPLQLDLGKLTTQERETPYMSSDDLLCEGIGYGTTKTYHDSIHIWGWRDNLAAWSELQESLTEGSGGYEEYGKQFHIMGEHLLTRNIKRYHNEGMNDNLLLQEKTLMIYGDDWNSNILNVGGFNLISEVAENQTLELRHLTVVNVGTGDVAEDPSHREYSRDTIWQKTHNEGTYILDNLHVDEDYAVVNDSVTIKRGTWDAYNIYTSYLRSEVKLDPERWADSYDAVAGTDAINNELHLQMDRENHGTTHITGTIEYNNVHNDEGAETYLKVHEERDYRKADGSTHFVDAALYDQSATTGAFQRFYCNSLSMNGGNFYLVNLNYQELMLRDLIIGDGTIHINATTVDLEKEEMGRIWAYHDAQYTGTGHIIVEEDALVIKPKDGISDAAHYIERDGKRGYETPVRFANKGVARSVVPFGKPDDYLDDTHTRSNHYMKEGKTYWYEADYCYEDVDDFKAGYYYYRRWLNDKGQSEFVPGVQVGPVAEAAGALGSMQQVQDHVFEHADLFADSVYSTQKERLRDRSFTVVNPTKGKNAVAAAVGAAAPKASLCGGKAGFKGGLWVRPYAGYEKLPLSGGPKVTNSLYGALVGGDTTLTEHRNGWASVFSAHVAYMGSTQKYSQRGSGVRINQNGGGVGVTGTLYYKNFYTALSGTVATAGGHANSSAGTENFRTIMTGVASRSGYNIELGKGRFVLQPTLLLAFNTVHMPDYTNAAGAHISSDPLNQLQVHPYVKFIMRTESCWVPYLTLGYVHNILGKTSYHADGVKLPEMSTDPYVEYSLGAQYSWADKYTIFGQATGRNGGRNGLEVSVGLRWAW